MPDVNGHSPSEAKIMILLGDGHPHRPDELKFVLDDPKMTDQNLRNTLYKLRSKLRLLGQDIVSDRGYNVLKYRLVRTTASHARNSVLE